MESLNNSINKVQDTNTFHIKQSRFSFLFISFKSYTDLLFRKKRRRRRKTCNQHLFKSHHISI